MEVEKIKLKIGDIISATKGELLCGSPDTVISGLSTDSRSIRPGQMFWALRGERFDGHDFIKSAYTKGAGALLIEKSKAQGVIDGISIPVIGVDDSIFAMGELARWWREIHDVKVVGITGSTGKSTTKEMTWFILNSTAPTIKNKGNFNNLIGLPLTILGIRDQHKRAVLEMGMNRPGEIGRLTLIASPDIGLITKVSEAHLEGVGDIKGVLKAKLELGEFLPPESILIINGDDELLVEGVMGMKREIVRFGLGPDNQIRAYDIKERGHKGTYFKIRHKKGEMELNLPVPGIHNVYNACASISAALLMGESEDAILKGISQFRPLKGRCNIIELSGGGLLIDDTYNSNPASLKAAIELAQSIRDSGGRLIVGLGDMLELGKMSGKKHQEAGKMVAQAGASLFVALGDYSAHMLEGAMEGGLPSQMLEIAEDQTQMASAILSAIKNGDVLLIKASRRIGLEKVVDIILKEKRKTE